MTEHSREWLLLNAVESWLHHYGNVGTPTVAEYKQLRDELFDAYAATISKDAEESTPPAPKSPRKRTTNASQSSAKTV